MDAAIFCELVAVRTISRKIDWTRNDRVTPYTSDVSLAKWIKTIGRSAHSVPADL